MPRLSLLRAVAAAAAATLLCACVTEADLMHPHLATPTTSKDKAIAIISVTHDARAGKNAHGVIFLDGRSPQSMMLRSAAGPMDPVMRNDFIDRVGEVYVLELAPGHHRFNTWFMYVGSTSARASRDELAPLEFDVAAGDVVYLGNIDFQMVMGKATPIGALAHVEDRAAIDVPIAERADPWLAGKAHVALLPVGPWQGKP